MKIPYWDRKALEAGWSSEVCLNFFLLSALALHSNDILYKGFVGFFGLFGSYYSLQYLSLSDATVLAFLSPTVTGILAAIFLKEPYTAKEAISGLISLGGAILVAQPSFLFGSLAEEEDPQERLKAVGVALIGVCSASAAYVTIRQIGKRAHALHSVTYFCIVSYAISCHFRLSWN